MLCTSPLGKGSAVLISGSLKKLNLEEIRSLNKIYSTFSQPGNTLIHVQVDLEGMNVSLITDALVENKGNLIHLVKLRSEGGQFPALAVVPWIFKYKN